MATTSCRSAEERRKMKIKLIIEIDCQSTLNEEVVATMLIDNICESMPGIILGEKTDKEDDVLIDSFEIDQEKG